MSPHSCNKQRRISNFKAIIFDMDGVITDTASAHAAAWKELFDEYLSERGDRDGVDYGTFDESLDYRLYVDGKPRYDGVRSFLRSRDIKLPDGEADDDPDQETICGLGNRKNMKFNQWLDSNRVRAYPSTLHLVNQLRESQIGVGAFSASRNCRAVLASAGVLELFDAIVDGEEAARLRLPGKPDPAVLLRTAEMLQSDPSRTIVVEDAIAGVEAGVAGGFHAVIGIDRGEYGAELEASGADVVVRDLAELEAADGCLVLKTIATLPSAWTERSQIAAKLANRPTAVFLDYDGTLTPIVSDYRAAFLSEEMRQAVANLAATMPVAVISGRDLRDVRDLVALEQLYYAGSHGFELSGPGGFEMVQPEVEAFRENLEVAERALHSRIDGIEGSAIERKRFTIAVHYRNVADKHVSDIKQAVDKVLAKVPHLRKGDGKKVLELKPDLDWDKGAAVEELCSALKLNTEETSVVYIGDDLTDEDAFRVTVANSIGIIVRDQDRQTAADYVLEDTDEVQTFLQWLADLSEEKK
jgi:alpha,alpha-trehalase